MLHLDRKARAYFDALPYQTRLGFVNSNLDFYTVEDLKDYQHTMLDHMNEVLYSRLPDPAMPSNAALDPLDSLDP